MATRKSSSINLGASEFANSNPGQIFFIQMVLFHTSTYMDDEELEAYTSAYKNSYLPVLLGFSGEVLKTSNASQYTIKSFVLPTSSLKRLTFSGCKLPWEDISTLVMFAQS
ncbi:hypothetical protein HAX54_025031 [Datura stramonium]|uniref:Uncharacterized protein n=1 Tax=Datura stramonium TaxID=4076 RepID=A0ABS8UZL3_DATST|nr:hypothetical protein [Datura stramonium]